MLDELRYPQVDAMKSVLTKLGIDISCRFDEYDQDYEYTTCRVEELDAYLKLYEEKDTTPEEKRLLGCYFLECLNDHVANEATAHSGQDEAFTILHRDIAIHQSELEYWTETSKLSDDLSWPITKEILAWRKKEES